jgi:hypothetical protein
MNDQSSPSKESPVVQTAKQRIASNGYEPNIITLKTGDVVEILPVSASLIDEVTSRVKDPEIPMWHNDDKGRDEPNPSDPVYVRELADIERQRGIAALDAMIMFGVKLVDGVPEDERWLDNLKFMEMQGLLDLESYNLDDELTREFLYKRFIAVDTPLITLISEVSGMTGEEIEQAQKSFPSN